MAKESTINKRQKKADRREAKAQRKASNKKEEKRNTPNNLLLGLLIFGIIGALFFVGWLIQYIPKPATLQAYINENKDMYKNVQIDEETVVDVSAKKNKMKVTMTVTSEDKETIKLIKENYKTGEDATKNVKYFGAYYMSSIRPQTKAIFADAQIKIMLNGKEIASSSITGFDADRIMNGTYWPEDDKDTSKDTEEDTAEDATESTTEVNLDTDNTIEINADDLESGEAQSFTVDE